MSASIASQCHIVGIHQLKAAIVVYAGHGIDYFCNLVNIIEVEQ